MSESVDILRSTVLNRRSFGKKAGGFLAGVGTLLGVKTAASGLDQVSEKADTLIPGWPEGVDFLYLSVTASKITNGVSMGYSSMNLKKHPTWMVVHEYLHRDGRRSFKVEYLNDEPVVYNTALSTHRIAAYGVGKP